MQTCCPSKAKSDMLTKLAFKIGRLKRKLLSYGWTAQDVSRVIMNEFLKIGQLNWKIPNNTTAFYQMRDRYHVDGQTAEMMLCLQRLIPNLEVKQVCEYLTSVLQYNSLAFGIDLSDSSSDSSEDFSSLKTTKPKFRWKNSDKLRKRNNLHIAEQKPRKKHHENIQQVEKQPKTDRVSQLQPESWFPKAEQSEIAASPSWKKRPPQESIREEEKDVQKKLKKQ